VASTNEQVERRGHAEMEQTIRGINVKAACVHLPVRKLGNPGTRDRARHPEATNEKRNGLRMVAESGDQPLGESDGDCLRITQVLLPASGLVVVQVPKFLRPFLEGHQAVER